MVHAGAPEGADAEDGPTPTAPPLLSSRAAHQVGLLAAYSLAALAGRATIPDGQAFALVWPAAGIGVLWVLWAASRGAGAVGLASLLLAGSTAVVHLLTGAGAELAAVLTAANLVQALAGAQCLRLAAQHRGPGARTAGAGSLRGAVALLITAAVTAGVGVAVGALGSAVALGPAALDADAYWTWWGRNATGVVLVVGLVQLLREAGLLPPTWSRWAARATRPSARRVVEGGSLALLTVACFVFVFARDGRVLVPLLALTLWTALRWTPLLAAAYTSAVGAAMLSLSAAGIGSFAAISDVAEGTVTLQLAVAALAALAAVVSGAAADQRRLLSAAHETEQELRARAELYVAVAESMEDGVIVRDARGVVVAANAVATRLVGAVPGRSAGTGEVTLLRTDGSPLPLDEYPFVEAIRHGQAPPRDLVLRAKGQPTRVLSVSAKRLLGVPTIETSALGTEAPGLTTSDYLPPWPCDGAGAVVVFRDVTADRAQRDELAGFAGTVAHDLRSPLSAVRGWVELSQNESQAWSHRTDLALWLGKAYDATDRMATLIDDLLQHASSDGRQLRFTDLDLDRIAGETVALHGLDDFVTIGPLPEVWADDVLVRQLLGNLLVNAVKYVDPDVVAQVRITGRIVGDGVELTVSDNGIGIPAEERTAVFDRFHRAHLERTEFRGSGLGLAVCRNIVERHGGRIAAEAGAAGRGSRFVFTLPRSARRADLRTRSQ